MGALGILSLVLGLLGLATGAGVGIMQSQKNEQLVRETNATNLQAVRETNASNVEQAELAYRRSLPINQVNNMIAAGMSRSAAIQSLTGGGTYQAPVLQSSSADSPQVDYSGFASAFERLGNIPSNAEQYNIQLQQRKNLEQEFQLREKEEQRKQEMHNAVIDEKNYSKWERDIMDDFMSLMENTSQEKNIQPSPDQSMHDYVRALGLQDNEMYKKLPVSARQRAFDKFKQIQEESRAQESSHDSHIASRDAHDLAELQKVIQRINVKYYDKEKNESLLNLMRTGQGIIQDNNIKFADLQAKDMENMVREAGIDNEREARMLAEYVNKLSQEDEIDIAYKRASANRNTLGVHNQFRVLLRDLGELLMKVKL